MNKTSCGFECEFRDWSTYQQQVVRVNNAPYLYILRSGSLLFYRGDTVSVLEPKHICWWPSGVTTHIANNSPLTQGYIVRLRRSGFATHLQADRQGLNFCDRCERYVNLSSPILPMQPRTQNRLMQIIRQMNSAWEGTDQFRSLHLKSAGMNILSHLASDAPFRTFLNKLPSGNHDARMAELINWMEDHLAEPMTIDLMAQQVELSRSRFTEVFRHYSGRSPQDYLRRMRVSRACHYLRYQDNSVTEICFQSGFGSLARFHAAFQSIIGLAPGKWRAAHRP